LGIIMLVIVIMIVSVYSFSKSFYKDHLTDEVQNRLSLYSSILQVNYDEETLKSTLKLDEDTIHFVLFDQFLNPLFTSTEAANQNVDHYRNWMVGKDITQEPIIEHVETNMDFHIPHIWATKKIIANGQVVYLFLDQDTGEFENTKIRLLKLLLFMGLLSFLVGLLFTVYLSRKISKPLRAMGKITNQIAKGDFDAQLDIHGSDEIGELAEDIRLMAKQLKTYRDSRQQLLSNISHDLRTPLTYIKAYSAVMKDAPKVEEQEWRGYVKIIYQEALRMEHLVKDLFELTKLDEGQVKLHFEEVLLIPWLKSIVESRQLMFKKHSIATQVSYDYEGISVPIDKERMTQVINNLLENSIRYTVGGKIEIKVDSSAGEYVTIEIHDSGTGIPVEDLAYIWDRFYRVDKSRSMASGGSGLGLSIVKELVSLHNGEIAVQSQHREGTVFTIKLKRYTH
jgi:signal transduction histidine kinase